MTSVIFTEYSLLEGRRKIFSRICGERFDEIKIFVSPGTYVTERFQIWIRERVMPYLHANGTLILEVS